MEELNNYQLQILNKLYQDFQQSIDSVTEDDFLYLKLTLEELRLQLKFLESESLIHIRERKGSGILQWIQITKKGIGFIEESCGCS